MRKPGPGKFKLKGGKGDDSIVGGAGNDRIDGKGGNDTLDGGAGNDKIKGGKGNDSVFGGPGNDKIDGGAGNDTLDGGAGNDKIRGGMGDDTLLGSVGDDKLDGGKGDDIIDGGAGDDVLKGGKGADTFVFGDGYGSDTIKDFKPGTDTLDLSGVTGISSFEQLQSMISEADEGGKGKHGKGHGGKGGEGTVIQLPDGSTLTLKGVPPDQLTPANFTFNTLCFTAGTLIDTPDGLRAVEDLTAGDQVITLDRGPQALRWVGQRLLHFDARPHRHKPVLIPAGALGEGLPLRDLIVSPLHRLLLRGWQADLMFGEPEVLLAARQLIGFAEIRQIEEARSVDYVHFLFGRHEIVYAEGALAESLHPGPAAISGLNAAHRAELIEIFPELAADPSGVVRQMGPLVRRELRGYEATALLRARDAVKSTPVATI